MNNLRLPHTSLAVELLLLYWSGRSVSSLSAITGLSESGVIARLCAAARSLDNSEWTALDGEGGLGVQWEFVCFRG